MSPPLPSSFVGVQTAKASPRDCYVSVIGVVVDVLSPCRTKGSSFLSTFTIMDSDFDREPRNGLKIKYFNDSQSVLPDPKVGDAVLVRKIRIAQFQGSLVGLSTQQETIPWTIFSLPASRGRNLIINSSSGSRVPSGSEKSYVISLLNRDEGLELPQKPRTTSPEKNVMVPRPNFRVQEPPRRFSLIKDMTVDTFVDLVVQVVKTFYEGERLLLYVTDYSSNKALFNYSRNIDEDGRDGDEFNYTSRYKRRWPGPFGRMTLQVTLWDPHSFFAKQYVNVDDFVLLRNVRIKTGHSEVARLEGAMHTDKMYPDKVNVLLLNDESDNVHLRDVMKRKLDYSKRIKAEDAQLNNGLENSKRKPDDDEKPSKKARKKQTKKANKEEDQDKAVSPAHDKNSLLNPNIKTYNVAIPYRSISDILHNESHNNKTPDGIEYRLPFQNVRYRSRLRVVDFFPHRLEDFAVAYKKDIDHLSDAEIDDEAELVSELSGSVTWEWRFCLLVEDGIPTTQISKSEPRERMELMVAKSDAEHLLCMNAVDLQQNTEAVSQLREKLFLLWGDLEERKRPDPENFNADSPGSAKPFACFIKEYGIKAKKGDTTSSIEEEVEQDPSLGWERRFAIFGTRVSDEMPVLDGHHDGFRTDRVHRVP